MLHAPFSSWPSFTEEEAEAVKAVLLSNKVNYWTGQKCSDFEKAFAAWCGVDYAISLANGTLSLELALRALGIGEGDEVIVTSRTFIASVSCIIAVGAKPVFADVESNSGNISASTIAPVLSKRTRAIICVHLAGWPCDMDPIMAMANELGLYVIEDCAQSHGAHYKGRSVGSIGHIGAWSFCQDKIMTTGGEGGMVTTNDKKLWELMWSYKDHGKSYDAAFHQNHAPGYRWVHESFGSNLRMTEMQAAIGLIQLGRMADWHQKRTRNAALLLEVCKAFPDVIRVPDVPTDFQHAWYKCQVYLVNNGLKANWSRERVIETINSNGVPCYYGSCSEVYLEKAFDDTGLRPSSRLPVSKELGETTMMFLVHPTLTDNEIEKTCVTINQVFKAASL